MRKRRRTKPSDPDHRLSDHLADFKSFLRNLTDAQVKGAWEKEIKGDRRITAEQAKDEASRRGISHVDWVHPGPRRFEDIDHD